MQNDFQATLVVIASLAQARRSNLLKLFLNEPQGEFKNDFRVAYPKKRHCKNAFRQPENGLKRVAGKLHSLRLLDIL